MGNWTLDRIATNGSDLNGDIYGTNLRAVFHLRYTTSPLRSFKETPRLVWHETIMMNDHQNNQFWLYDVNMYAHKPVSNTLKVWARRYLEAYRSAAGQGPSPTLLGSVEFKSLSGQPVRLADLGGAKTTPTAQANAVRDYLKDHGGQFIITVHDRPGLGTTSAPPYDRERLLLFDIGMEGSALHAKAEQYLRIGSGTPQANWQREFSNGSWPRARLARPAGFTNTTPPPNITAVTPPIFTEGECW